jgi:hypothetical protein
MVIDAVLAGGLLQYESQCAHFGASSLKRRSDQRCSLIRLAGRDIDDPCRAPPARHYSKTAGHFLASLLSHSGGNPLFVRSHLAVYIVKEVPRFRTPPLPFLRIEPGAVFAVVDPAAGVEFQFGSGGV